MGNIGLRGALKPVPALQAFVETRRNPIHGGSAAAIRGR